jgi:hypothetical protein
MDPTEALRREMSGQAPRDAEAPRKKRDRKSRSSAPDKPRQPRAGFEESQVAEAWMREAESRDLAVPFDANWLALQIAERVRVDPEMSRYPDPDQVHRWLIKMVEVWWKEWTAEGVDRRNASSMFLDVDWDDIRYYARISLRAKYLKEHGTWVEPPIYVGQQEYTQTLDEIRTAQRIKEMQKQAEEHPLPQAEVDETRRERLRSWRERRRSKK